MEARNTGLRLVGRSDILKVSATDVQDRPGGCGTYGALKVRPNLQTPDWRRRYDNSQPFLLGLIRDIACRIQGDPRTETWEGMNALIQAELAAHSLHPGSRSFASHAIETYIEAHESIAQEVGELKLRTFDPQVYPAAGNTLTVWAPIYENATGVREVRRLRFKQARKAGRTNERWTSVAAHVASLMRPIEEIRRIRVVEIGLLDGSIETVFDDSPSRARELFTEVALPDLERVIGGSGAFPGLSCKECKVAGCCEALTTLNGFLGQKSPGIATRSLSAWDIETYEKCPAQWHLARSCNLPNESKSGAASERGRIVHHWLATAHSRSRKCTLSDIGAYGDPESFTSTLTDEEYSLAQDYLRSHVSTCALSDETQVISIEAPVYGYDAPADVIIASAPDMIYIDAENNLVIRETKTTQTAPENSGDAFDRFFSVAWLLNLFESGYKGPYESDSARLELEVITPEDSRVFTWDISDRGVLRMANAEVRQRARVWHQDNRWEAVPGKHCGWCPVRRWCPDAETDDVNDPPLP